MFLALVLSKFSCTDTLSGLGNLDFNVQLCTYKLPIFVAPDRHRIEHVPAHTENVTTDNMAQTLSSQSAQLKRFMHEVKCISMQDFFYYFFFIFLANGGSFVPK